MPRLPRTIAAALVLAAAPGVLATPPADTGPEVPLEAELQNGSGPTIQTGADALTRDEVARVLGRLQLATDVRPGTRVTFTIAADGAVREVRISPESLANPVLAAAVRRLRFPAPRGGGEVEVRFAPIVRWHLPTGPRACHDERSTRNRGPESCPELTRLPWAPALDADTRADLTSCVPVPSPVRVEIAVEPDAKGFVRDVQVRADVADASLPEDRRRAMLACLTARVWGWQLPPDATGPQVVEVDFRPAPRRVMARGLSERGVDAVEDCAAMAWRLDPAFETILRFRRERAGVVLTSSGGARWPELEACVRDRLEALDEPALPGGEAALKIRPDPAIERARATGALPPQVPGSPRLSGATEPATPSRSDPASGKSSAR